MISLKATPVFADIDALTLTIDPEDVARKITVRTRAIVVVHLLGYPAEMDAILPLARARGIRVIEDASHAYKINPQRKGPSNLGMLSFSLCGKPLSAGEGGIVATESDREIFERIISWGHSSRYNANEVRRPELLRFAGMPLVE